MSIVWIMACCSVLILVGVWARERLPRWQEAATRARRDPLTEAEFGARFFGPDQAGLAARLRHIAAEQLGKELTRLRPDDSLAQTLFDASDSLDSVELLIAIEEEFGIELDDAAAEKVATFRDLVNAVAARQPFLVKWRQKLGRATEEQFGVSLPREVLARVTTSSELADAVATALGDQVRAQESCQSQRAFYLLRSAIMRTLRVPRSLISPTMPLDKLIRWRTASSAWPQLRDAGRARQWPPLVRPRWMPWLICGSPIIGGTALAFALPVLADETWLGGGAWGTTVILISALRGFIVVPLVIFSWVLLVRLSKRFSRALPRNLRTVGDLVPFLATSTEMTWTREQIEHRVREIVVKQLRVPTEGYRAGGRFVEEFGLEVGMQNP